VDVKYEILLAQTYQEAKSAVEEYALEGVHPIGMGAPVYASPNRMYVKGPITLDERTMEWIRWGPVLNAREITWLK